MNVLIQNRSKAPVTLQMNKMEGGKPAPMARIVFEPDNQISTVSEEVYRFMLNSPFYKAKFEKGELLALNGDSETKQSNENIQSEELFYNRYVALCDRIFASGGLANEQLRPFLDADGMPTYDLVKKNLGEGFEAASVTNYRNRYLVEKQNGLHTNSLFLPTGSQVATGNANVTITEKPEESEKQTPAERGLEELTLEELKAVADNLNVTYAEDITFNRLLARVKKAQEAATK